MSENLQSHALKLLDSLFANQALDVENDIEVMNTLLKREGLSGGAGAI